MKQELERTIEAVQEQLVNLIVVRAQLGSRPEGLAVVNETLDESIGILFDLQDRLIEEYETEHMITEEVVH